VGAAERRLSRVQPSLDPYRPSLRCVPPRFMRSYNDLLFLAENVVSLMSKGKSFGAARNIRVKLVECVDNSLHDIGSQPTTTATQQLLYLSCLFLRSQSSCTLMAGRVMTKLHKCLFAFLLVPAIYDADQKFKMVPLSARSERSALMKDVLQQLFVARFVVVFEVISNRSTLFGGTSFGSPHSPYSMGHIFHLAPCVRKSHLHSTRV
jgi:hypothetical protein